MFTKAINKFEQNKPKPVTKSTSPTATRKVEQTKISPSAFQSRPTPPASSSSTRPSVQSNIRYPTLNPKSNLANHFHSEDSFRENIPPRTEISTSSTIEDYGVYYNYDDFEDDLDLDFDSPVPIKQKPPTPRAKETVYPTLPPLPKPTEPIKTDPDVMDLTSDAPLEWPASSPPHAPKREEEELIPVPAPTLRNKRKDPEPQPKQEEQITKKRRVGRQLPWSTPAPEVTQPVKVKAETKKPAAGPGWDSLAADKMSGGKAAVRKANASKKDPESALELVRHKPRPATVFLSEEQRTVVKLVAHGKKSVFFTGAAGTGKSVLLRELIATLKKQHIRDNDSVAVTASTGLAACNIGGVTLHSFAGIGLGKEPVPDLVKKIRKNNKATQRWKKTKILVIDEISMVDGDLFDKLEGIARNIKNTGLPFGGIQLVITGDFFQLPPVPENNRMAKFAFDANSWNTCITHTIGLTKVFRQKDPEFANMLNELRLGKITEKSVQTFKQLSRKLQFNDGVEPTELFSTRNEVDSANGERMRNLKGESMSFAAEDKGTVDKQFRDKLLSNCMAPAKLELKINSQVMLIKNLDETLVNGSLGRVVGFMNEKTWDVQKDDEYVLDADDLPKPASKPTDTGHVWPLVQFVLPDGTSRQLLVPPESWKIELPSGEVQAERSQVPLILAWALSIHKAQGQTLERVKVNLGRVFEKGQAYVALSRATCKEGLQVMGFDAKRVMCHEKVRVFYDNLKSADEFAEEAEKAAEKAQKGRKNIL